MKITNPQHLIIGHQTKHLLRIDPILFIGLHIHPCTHHHKIHNNIPTHIVKIYRQLLQLWDKIILHLLQHLPNHRCHHIHLIIQFEYRLLTNSPKLPHPQQRAINRTWQIRNSTHSLHIRLIDILIVIARHGRVLWTHWLESNLVKHLLRGEEFTQYSETIYCE